MTLHLRLPPWDRKEESMNITADFFGSGEPADVLASLVDASSIASVAMVALRWNLCPTPFAVDF
jgi:hypothetical protein